MKSVFVYYCDDVGSENEGFERFDTQALAISFIEDRMLNDHTKSLSQYKVIEGIELKITVVDIIKSIRLD